jgi:hypothetical protein
MRLNTAITESEGDDESEGLVAGLKAKRNKIMTILHRAEDEDIPEMLRNYKKIESKEILSTVSINENHKMELSIILKAKDYEDAFAGVYKDTRRKKDNIFMSTYLQRTKTKNVFFTRNVKLNTLCQRAVKIFLKYAWMRELLMMKSLLSLLIN